MTVIRVVLQVCICILFNEIGKGLSQLFHLPIPGHVIGLVLLLLVLKQEWLRMEWLEEGAEWLLGELLLFFIPSVVGVIQFKALLAENSLGLLFVMGVGTLMVMMVTAWFVEQLYRYRRRGHHGE
ncbi:CidA/LrgA family protein [Thermoflavimicrobium daqui]|uniref:Holin-like protein n=1 Tax=Thermoflavimicrobium daqui TaxID=2137476 RepID=A0A364K4M8_9BACL|nr:CidA/LrgA family protein [Thermoflavimicrobium daqui]RAL24219.1 hypothetical protein DL897_11105 [Thermoflavimicrobium daqui]